VKAYRVDQRYPPGSTAMTATIEHYINDQRVSRDDRYQDVYNPATMIKIFQIIDSEP